MLVCTKCGWVFGPLIAYPKSCPKCGAHKRHLVKDETG
jgi:hypothetical protein